MIDGGTALKETGEFFCQAKHRVHLLFIVTMAINCQIYILFYASWRKCCYCYGRKTENRFSHGIITRAVKIRSTFNHHSNNWRLGKGDKWGDEKTDKDMLRLYRTGKL